MLRAYSGVVIASAGGRVSSSSLSAAALIRGYEVPFICPEDWGWWVEISGNPFVTGVRVYATGSLPETKELCAVAAPDPGHKWSWRRFRFVEATAVSTKLQANLIEIFNEDPEIEVLGFPEGYPLT
jgi:hypothetical protein